MAKILFSLFCLVNISLFGQSMQWASEVIDFSSEFKYDKKPGQYLANQMLGTPSVFSNAEASPCSYAPGKENNPDGEYVEVGFEHPQRVSQVVVNENFNAGAISSVSYRDSAGVLHPIYSAQPQKVEGGRLLRVIKEKTSYRVYSVHIVLKTAAVSGFNQIDAVGISADTIPFNISINLTENANEPITLVHLGNQVNSQSDELCPVISPDAKTLYFTRDDNPDNIGEANQDIWMADLDEEFNASNIRNIGSPLNTDWNNTLSSIMPDGQKALLLNVYNEDGTGAAGVSFSEKKGGNWTRPQKVNMPDYVNQSNYGEYSLSHSGNIIIMAVQRDESIGDKDLFVSFKTDSVWTKPVSLGNVVNTAGSEVSPFLASDNRTLYYATSGFPGYGSKDIFMTRRIGEGWTNWTAPVNLGPYLNTPKFDAYYSVTASGNMIFMSSHKEGGEGGSDIYRAALPPKLQPLPVILVYGKVYNKDNHEPLPTAVSYYSLSTGEKIGEALSDSLTGNYKIVLPAGDHYGFSANKDGFLSVSESIDLTGRTTYEEVEQDLELVPIRLNAKITVKNVYFNTDAYELRDESFVELNALIEILSQNPLIKVEISGHTDDVGSAGYNLTLSENRAAAVRKYLISKGIKADRLTSKGYGESQPIATNETEQGRQDNRRVEFKVTAVE